VETEAKVGVVPDAPVETPEAFNARRDAEILKWNKDKLLLTSIKEEEATSRATVAATLFPNPKKGTNRYQLGNGYAVKLVYGTTYTLGDKTKVRDTPDGQVPVPINNQVNEALARIRGLGNRGHELADELVKWKPELSEKAYLALNAEGADETDKMAKKIIDEILTTKPASPQLEFETPKPPKQ
jgi:hypothetical protein